MAHFVCPWWGGYFIDNPLRRWLHNPARILSPLISPGMTVLDFGCGMGVFSISLARMLGDDGTVISADLQAQMLKAVEKRARRAGMENRIRTHQCLRDSLDFDEPIDFALAFWSAHEVPDLSRLLAEIHTCLVPGGKLLVVEPRGHVTRQGFAEMIDQAEQAGFETAADPPQARLSHTVVLRKA